MADIHIHRPHRLGLPRARELAQRWLEDAERRFDLQCERVEGDGEGADTVRFKRSGVKGRLVVAADHFALDAQLGLLMGAFRDRIESEIGKGLDTLLAAEDADPAAGPDAGPG